MMPQSAQKATRWTGICCLVTLLLSSVCFPAYAAKGRDFIVVMDISTSMADIFDKAKSEAKQFVSSAQLDDRVIVITFGKSSLVVVERAAIQRISMPEAKRKRLFGVGRAFGASNGHA